MNTNAPKVIAKFRLDAEDFKADKTIQNAFDLYQIARGTFCVAKKELAEKIQALHDLLDNPLRSGGHVDAGKDWSFKDDDTEDGLIVYVWSEPKQRGRRKAVPYQTLNVRQPKAA